MKLQIIEEGKDKPATLVYANCKSVEIKIAIAAAILLTNQLYAILPTCEE
jgi:hypothetical protein